MANCIVSIDLKQVSSSRYLVVSWHQDIWRLFKIGTHDIYRDIEGIPQHYYAGNTAGRLRIVYRCIAGLGKTMVLRKVFLRFLEVVERFLRHINFKSQVILGTNN